MTLPWATTGDLRVKVLKLPYLDINPDPQALLGAWARLQNRKEVAEVKHG